MPGFLLHAGATVNCAHLPGVAQPAASSPRVKVGGQPIVTQTAQYTVAGCALTGTPNPPCATAQWMTGATRVRSSGVPVLLHVLEVLPSLRHGLVMIQSEVVDRLASPPGGREYGAPSAKLAWYASARRAGPVPRAVFWPVPGVDSALLSIRGHPAPPEPGVTRAEVFAVVDAAFAQRRKSLRGALAGWAGSPVAAEQVLRAAGVDPSTRAERLSVADFTRIAAARGPGGAAHGPCGSATGPHT